MKKLSLLVLLLFLAQFSFSQNTTYGNTNTWGLLLNEVRLNSNWVMFNELHHRTGSFLDNKAQFIFRPSIAYQTNENTEFSVGYSYLRNWSYEPYTRLLPSNEHNVWSQMLQKWQVGKVKFQNRFRQENRFIDTASIVNGNPEISGTKFANRFRYRITATFDVVDLEKEGRSVFLNFFDEIWIIQSDNLMPETFSRNWFYAGLGYKIDGSHDVQLGIMNQYDITGANTYISSNILQLTVVKGFNLSKE